MILRKILTTYWKFFVIVITPIILLPLPIIAGTAESKCGYVILLTSVFWMTESLPLAVTSLIPVALLPLLGVVSTSNVTPNYMTSTGMLFVGGLTMALAIEHCNLHRRIALNAMSLIGVSSRRLMLAFMIPTAFLSMWISNTATTAMMIPTLEVVVQELSEHHKDNPNLCKNNRAMLSMSICIAANIGGTATIVGSATNVILINNLEVFGNEHPLTFAAWMVFNLPCVILNLIIVWIWLQIYFNGWKKTFSCKKSTQLEDAKTEKAIARLVKERCKELGPMNFREWSVFVLFLILVFLWFFRSPGFFPGWGDGLEEVFDDLISISDATPAILIMIFLFILPAKPYYLDVFRKGKLQYKSSDSLLNWKIVEQCLPWGVILLVGGGLALADASDRSCLSAWIGQQLEDLKNIAPWILCIILTLAACLLTQIIQNTATSSMLLPVYRQLALEMEINPLLLMLPPTIAISYSFMFPISTAPNAIAFQSSGMSVYEMSKVGSVATILCLIMVFGCVFTYGYAMFDLGTFPDWANNLNSINDTQQCVFNG